MHNTKLKTAIMILAVALPAQWLQAQSATDKRDTPLPEFLRAFRSLDLSSCIEDVPAPKLLPEPRYTQGTSNTIWFQLPPVATLPFPPDSVKGPFVITFARNAGDDNVLSFPRPVDLTVDSLQFETMNGLQQGNQYSYSIALFLPVCKLKCDAIVDSSELELHCSPHADTVWSIQDSQAPGVADIRIPQLDSTSVPHWWNYSSFRVNARLQDEAGVWQAFLYRRSCQDSGWQSIVADTVFPGNLTPLGHEFAPTASVMFLQDLPDGCYDFRVEGRDASHTPESRFPDFRLAGNGGQPAEDAAAHVTIYIDTSPPRAVELNCQQIQNSIRLSWTASSDGTGIGLAGYRVSRDGDLITILPPSETLYDDNFSADTPDMELVYQIQPFDSLGTIQRVGGTANCPYNKFTRLTILPEPEYTAGNSNQVCWTGSSQIDSFSVFIARDGDFESAVRHTVSDTCFTFQGLVDGSTYSFWVEAEDRQQRPVFSDTVSSIQDASFPEISTLQVENRILLGNRNWVDRRNIAIKIAARDFSPGKIKLIEVFENGEPKSTFALDPTVEHIDTTLAYPLTSEACVPIDLSVWVVDAADNPSGLSQITLRLDDTGPDSVETFNCEQLTSANGIELTWSASSDPGNCSGLAGYHLLREDSTIATVGPNVLRYEDLFSDDTPSRQFTYQVQPFDSVGHVQTDGGRDRCEYVGSSRIEIQSMRKFTKGLSNKVCWRISGALVSAQVFLDANCDLVAEDSVVIESPGSSLTCHEFDELRDGQRYCYWLEGIDFQQRRVVSKVVFSVQDDSPPVIDRLTLPDGESLKGKIWVFSPDIRLHLVAHDLQNGEIWDYVIRENDLPEQTVAFRDSLPRVDEMLPYGIQSSAKRPVGIDFSVQVVDGAGNKSEASSLRFFLQDKLPAMFAYPNPFNPMQGGVTIRLHSPQETEIKIYDFFGNLVRAIREKETSRDFIWDGRNGNGRMVANGGYICIGTKTRARFKIGVVKHGQ